MDGEVQDTDRPSGEEQSGTLWQTGPHRHSGRPVTSCESKRTCSGVGASEFKGNQGIYLPALVILSREAFAGVYSLSL